MNYKQYTQARKQQILNLIEEEIIHLADSTKIEDVLNDALTEYEEKVFQKAKELYASQGLYPEEWRLERDIQKISDSQTRQRVSNHFWNLVLLQETVYNYLEEEQDPTQREHESIDELLAKMPHSQRKEAKKILNRYIEEYQEEPQFLGKGETTTSFKIGNKVIKFGSKRQYPQIPLCLDIHDQIEYAPGQYMYTTDLLDTQNIPEQAGEAMYRALRTKGYVWLDPKSSNIGTLNGSIKILDDVDIYTEDDAIKHGKKSVLDAVSHTDELAMYELRYIDSMLPSFDINQIDILFSNESNESRRRINHLKELYIRETKSYAFDPNKVYYSSFKSILSQKVSEQNQLSASQPDAHKQNIS